ncbi:MAG TPA: DUF5722 domain-containing protein [Gaiellaceae bacterium]|nr:DUF5722 domain-containing protein [Gaiellaceae bacterium]
MRSRLALLAATVAVAALAGAPEAQASRFIQPGIYDDAQILYGDADTVFPRLAEMHTKLIRVNLWWGGPALTVAKRRPANASDPDDPAYDWGTYDRTVRYARIYGMRVVFSIVGTPRWANGGKSWNTAPTRPTDLRAFARAAARRYSGRFPGPDGAVLPAVRFWLAWNEPNNPVFLMPQFVRVKGAWVIRSAQSYAQMCNAIVTGTKSVSRSNKVACGVTSPRGNNNPNSSRTSVAPLAFLRAMKTAGAKGFDAYAHHPYYGRRSETPVTPPPTPPRGQPPTAVTLGNFQVLTTELRKLYGKKRIWVTEYGYQTNPPDKLFGVSYAQQAAYMEQAFQKLKANPLVDMFIWFLIRDEVRADGWQSGVFTRSWQRKPSREIFENLLG